MNNKGQMFMAVLFAVVVFVFGMLFINFIKDDITITTSVTGLDCDNMAISDGTKMVCLGFDLGIPYLFLLIVSASAGLIAARLSL